MTFRLGRLSALGLFALLSMAGTGHAETFIIDASHSNVTFSVRHIVSQVKGAFTDFSGTVVYDQKHPEKSSVQATIKTKSIDTNSKRRDNHLMSPDFFNAEQYPEIVFASTAVEKKGDRLMVTGNLSMHGKTHEVTMPVEVLGVGTHPRTKTAVAGFVAELSIKRSHFGVNSWTDVAGVLGDDVKIDLNIEAAVRSSAKNPCNPCNPCAKKNPCNPCGKKNPCNPCAKKNPCNPCAKKNPCNPCAK